MLIGYESPFEALVLTDAASAAAAAFEAQAASLRKTGPAASTPYSRAPACLPRRPFAHDRRGTDQQTREETRWTRRRLQELSDVREIVDVMNQYTTALDTRNWDDARGDDDARRPGRLRQPRRRRHPRQPAGARRPLPQVAPGPAGDAAPAGELRRRGERRHRAGELLPPGEPLPGRAARRRHVRRVGQVPRRLRPHRERLEDQEALPRHDLRRREHEPLHRGRRGRGRKARSATRRASSGAARAPLAAAEVAPRGTAATRSTAGSTSSGRS